MPWVRLDDGFDEHAELEALSDGALRMLICSWTYSGRNLTDGFIPDARVLRLTPTAKPRHIDELLAGGHWLRVEGGYQVPSFLTYNPSRAKVLEERAQSAERVRKHRESRRSNAVTNGEVIRSRPDQTPSIDPFVKDFTVSAEQPVEKPSLEVVKETIAGAKSSLRDTHPRRAS